MINLSLGGVRDPLNPYRDTFSALEAAAVSYAYSRGAVLVAAVGNADQAPTRPWPFASYPAALPHVIGVSALGRDGSVPTFSDRDKIFNDISAPGQDDPLDVPARADRASHRLRQPGLLGMWPGRIPPGGGNVVRRAARDRRGHAAPRRSAGPDPGPGSDAAYPGAVDVNASTGCKQCPLQRDALSGWGRLDIAAAVAQAVRGLAAADRQVRAERQRRPAAFRLWGPQRVVEATIDFWDDQSDVYAIRLRDASASRRR